MATQLTGGRNRVPVLHPDRLGALLREFLEPHHSHGHVAETLGLSRSRYSRLRRGLQTKSVTDRTGLMIHRALIPKMPRRRHHELLECFRSAEDVARATRHWDWLAGQLRPYHPGAGLQRSGIWGMPELSFIWRKDRKPGQRFRALDTLMDDLGKHGPAGRPGNPNYVDVVVRFVDWCHHEPAYTNFRILLSVVRVLGPFIDAIETDEHQETGWRTLHKQGEIERYLERGFAAQKLLIKTP